RHAPLRPKAHRARVPAPKSALHAAALALHCLLVSEGFVCTGQDDKAGAVKGFAAPVRDVPVDKLVPDRWWGDAPFVGAGGSSTRAGGTSCRSRQAGA
ncbi:MAG: hypothetical protein AAF085_09385, partial [Planctomycetota bacterium]